MADLAEAAAEFADLAKNLAQVGAVELRAELFKAINEAAQPIQQDIRRAMPDFMPNRYARALDDDLAIRVSKRTGTDPGVRIVGTGRTQRRKVARLNDGVLAHPLWGNRRHWYNQAVTPGFFTRPAEASLPQVRERILAALERIAEKAVGR